MYRVLLILVGALLLAPTAHALPLSRVPVVPGIEVRLEACPNTSDAFFSSASGCTWRGATVVYVAPTGAAGADDWTAFHELGHLFAFRVLGVNEDSVAGGMRKFANLTKTSGQPRAPLDVHEQFADAYAACALGFAPTVSEWGDEDSQFPTGRLYDPTPRAHRQVCALIVRAGARIGLRPQRT